MKLNKNINYLFICPYLINQSGHDYNYMMSVRNIFKKNKLSFQILSPKIYPKTKDFFLSQNLPTHPKKFFSKILYCFNFSKVLKNIIYLNYKNDEKKIIFLESFHFIHFIIVLLNIVLKKNFYLGVLLRYKNIFNVKSNLINNVFFVIRDLFFKNKLIFFTDSSKIQNFYSNKNIHINLLPIPHIKTKNFFDNIFNDNDISLWLPGPPREEKNISTIFNILLKTKKLPISLFLSKDVGQKFNNIKNININFVKPILSEFEYFSFFEKIDFIFLPYMPHVYSYSTSGIFVESISSNIPAFVTKGTWMDDEYKRFGIDLFTIEINDNLFVNLYEKVIFFKSNGCNNFNQMVKEYRNFHKPNNFLEKLTCNVNKFIL